jgi:hypothetical protein
MLSLPSNTAYGQNCFVQICKAADTGGEEVPFFFTIIFGDEEPEDNVVIPANGCLGILFELVPVVEVTENEIPGWELDDIVCETDGLIVTSIENGVSLECAGLQGGGTCTFFNVPGQGASANIPTLSEWGMIAAAAGLMLVGVWFAVRKRRARAVNS